MKLLKIVLIALVTFGIYSFTTNPISKKEEVNHKKEVIQEKQVTICFLPGLTESQKKEGRKYVQCQYNLTLEYLIETTASYEIWTYTKPPGTTHGNVSSGGTDNEAPPQSYTCNGGEYVSVQFNFDPNAPSFTFN